MAANNEQPFGRGGEQTLSDRIARLHRQLGIPSDYARVHQLDLQTEPDELAETEPDCFGRIQRLTPEALLAWQGMKAAAAEAGVKLFLVSAFRSIAYQGELLARKLAKGQTIAAILEVNAAPGYSEHHSGCAIDIGTADSPVLEEIFETTVAFAWLQQHAGDFGFRMSYPRDNCHQLTYEPWHWCYQSGNSR
ncbi:MAG: D-alanyl-D-alanine carboxypeptidase family protein [Pseudomonadales bacterium]|nr:D-alanyl-D-alanine carboxypeptidase family protein [Pseudomonadales bacterium]